MLAEYIHHDAYRAKFSIPKDTDYSANPVLLFKINMDLKAHHLHNLHFEDWSEMGIFIYSVSTRVFLSLCKGIIYAERAVKKQNATLGKMYKE
jgi:hypothetical protein